LGLCDSSWHKGEVCYDSGDGLVLGHFMAILCVAAGVGTLLSHYPILLSTMTIVGACYLFWMGISLLIRPAMISNETKQNQSLESAQSWLIKGVGISGLNPKVLLFFFFITAIYPPKVALSATAQILCVRNDSSN
jgi:threonine/homoserine/homoserine lactone efflux protein